MNLVSCSVFEVEVDTPIGVLYRHEIARLQILQHSLLCLKVCFTLRYSCLFTSDDEIIADIDSVNNRTFYILILFDVTVNCRDKLLF